MFAGSARTGDAMMLGPDTFGEFLPVSIKSVHSKRMAVAFAVAGQTAAFALRLPHGDKVRADTGLPWAVLMCLWRLRTAAATAAATVAARHATRRLTRAPQLKRSQIRKGMVLVAGSEKVPALVRRGGGGVTRFAAAADRAPCGISGLFMYLHMYVFIWFGGGGDARMHFTHARSQPCAVREFEAEVLILHHPTTIHVNYEPMVHARTVRQSARIIAMQKDYMRAGDRCVGALEPVCPLLARALSLSLCASVPLCLCVSLSLSLSACPSLPCLSPPLSLLLRGAAAARGWALTRARALRQLSRALPLRAPPGVHRRGLQHSVPRGPHEGHRPRRACVPRRQRRARMGGAGGRRRARRRRARRRAPSGARGVHGERDGWRLRRGRARGGGRRRGRHGRRRRRRA